MYSTRLQRAYPSDLTDAQWELLVPLIPPLSPEAAYHLHERREIVNGILDVLRSGCPWRAVLPLSVVDNSNFSPTRLTGLSTLLILASQGACSSPHFQQRGFVWSSRCSWSCLWCVSSS